MTNNAVLSRFDHSPWFHLLGGPILWTVHFLTSYAWVEFACRANLPLLGANILGLTVLSWSILIFTLIFVLAGLYVGWSAYRNWRRLKQHPQQNEADSWDTESKRFMALGGIALSMLFVVVILLSGLPALVLGPCL